MACVTRITFAESSEITFFRNFSQKLRKCLGLCLYKVLENWQKLCAYIIFLLFQEQEIANLKQYTMIKVFEMLYPSSINWKTKEICIKSKRDI